jgi:hypothetical protein
MNTQKMKRHCLLVLFTIIIGFQGNAQICIKAGIGVSDIVFSDEGQAPFLGFETDYLTHRYPLVTFQAGLSATVPLNRRFDFQPELLFAKQGLKYDMHFIYDHIENRAYIYYLQVPAIFRYRFAVNKKHQPNLFLGPYLGLKVHSKRIKKYNGDTKTSKVENARPLDFGLAGGFGYDFNLEKGAITAGFRIGYSLIDMMDPLEGYVPEYDIPGNLKARNISIAVMVGYRISSLFNIQRST